MSEVTTLVDRYIEMWNETDATRREALVAAIWTENALYLDPMLRGEGRDGISAMVGKVHDQFPGHRFSRTSDVDGHNGQVRFAWALGPGEGAPMVEGVDFASIRDGRLAAVTGFFDTVPQAPQG